MEKAFVCSLHLHSCLSPCGDGLMTPQNIAGMAALCGVEIAALTDHNTAGNCPAFFAACREQGIVPVAGVEVTTAEEIHLLCLFPTLAAAIDFDVFLRAHRPDFPNRPDIFGEQTYINENGEAAGEEPFLLLAATDLDLSSAAAACRERGGVALPAHIDRESGGLLSILGDFPPEPLFTAFELRDGENLAALRARHPALRELFPLFSSDAHTLEAMTAPAQTLWLSGDFEGEEERETRVRAALFARLSGEKTK